jgi:hypothetical protein
MELHPLRCLILRLNVVGKRNDQHQRSVWLRDIVKQNISSKVTKQRSDINN